MAATRPLRLYRGRATDFEVRADDRIAAVLNNILSSNEYQGDLRLLFNDKRVLRPHEIPDNLRVGGKGWVAVSEDKELEDLKKRVLKLEQNAEEDALMFGLPLVQNIAAQILLFALGRQPQAAAEGNGFLRLANGGDARLQNFVQRSAGLSETSFARLADKIIIRRNLSVHFADFPTLKMAIEGVKQLAGRHPSLRAKCKQEFLVFDNLEELAASFGLEPV